MKILGLLFIAVFLFTGFCYAQFYIEPIVGYQIGLNKNKFKQINSGLQFTYQLDKRYEFIFQLQKSWPVTTSSKDSAFSLNPAVPIFADAIKKIRPFTFSLALGHRIVVAGANTANAFSLMLYTGVAFEKIEVNYQYDKSNYTILNPDVTQKRTAPFLGFGLEYKHSFKRGRFFIQLNYSSAPIGKKINYPSSFGFINPLALNAGYSIQITRNEHEKK